MQGALFSISVPVAGRELHPLGIGAFARRTLGSGLDTDSFCAARSRTIRLPSSAPRWTAYDAKRFGVRMSDEVGMTTQERAYTSPIWYTPEN